MKKLTISQAKPNPTGKDRFYNVTPNSQLVAEWVDIKNDGDEGYSLSNLVLQHVAYSARYPNGLWTNVISFKGILGVGEVIRIHSGKEPLALASEDSYGADYHLYTDEDYVWNNDKSDTPRIKNSVTETVVDSATYDAYPEEGKVLKRVGQKLA